MKSEWCLLDVPRGRRARIRGLQGGGAQRSRLCAMGFTPGATVEVRQGTCGGCRVMIRDSSVVLDEEVARSVLCDPESTDTACLPGEDALKK